MQYASLTIGQPEKQALMEIPHASAFLAATAPDPDEDDLDGKPFDESDLDDDFDEDEDFEGEEEEFGIDEEDFDVDEDDFDLEEGEDLGFDDDLTEDIDDGDGADY